MASPAFGTQQLAGGSTAADVTINLPASTANGDFLLTAISKDATGAITVPGGWNELVNDTANTFHLWIGWRIASSEPASYTWNFASTWRDAYMQRYTSVYNPAPLDPTAPVAVVTGASVNTLTTGANVIATDDTRVIAVHTAKSLGAGWPATTATVDGVTMTVHTSTGAVEVHIMSGAKALATASEAGKAMSYVGPAGPMKAYMLVLASVAVGGAGLPPGLGPVVGMQMPHQMPPTI